MIRHRPGNVNRNNAREVNLTLQRPVVEIAHAPGIGAAENDVSGKEIPVGRVKIYFPEYYF
jgi:hypothetical protein